jgi:hypothetical protein
VKNLKTNKYIEGNEDKMDAQTAANHITAPKHLKMQ